MNQKTVSLKEISALLNIPLEVLKWNVLQNKEMTQGLHYTEESGETTVTLLGVIVLISNKITTEYEKLIFLLEPFFEKEKDNSFLLMLKSLIDGQLAMTEFEDDECEAVYEEEDPKKSNKDRFKATDDNVPDLTDENAIKWSVWARDNARAYVKAKKEEGENITFVLLLRKIYRIMSEKYGVDFAEAKKEFCKAYGLSMDTKVSNFRIVSDSPSGRKMFDEAMQEYTTNNL